MKDELTITFHRQMLDLALSDDSPIETKQWETYPYLRGALEMLRDYEELPSDLRYNWKATNAYISGVMHTLLWLQGQKSRLDDEFEKLEAALAAFREEVGGLHD